MVVTYDAGGHAPVGFLRKLHERAASSALRQRHLCSLCHGKPGIFLALSSDQKALSPERRRRVLAQPNLTGARPGVLVAVSGANSAGAKRQGGPFA